MSARASSILAACMGFGLSWFLLFPSLGVVQKHFGTLVSAGWVCAGAMLLIVGAGTLATAQSRWPILVFTSYALCGLTFGTLGVVSWWREGGAPATR